MSKVYVLGDENHEGSDGIHGIFSSLAALEEYQFKEKLGRMMVDITIWDTDKPDSMKGIPQLIRLNDELEEQCMQKDPNYKQAKLANSTLFCEDCQKELTACWECGYFHCKCNGSK